MTSTATLASRTVHRIGYGAMQLERLHTDREAAITLMRHAFDRGVDHVDTAQFYGDGFVNGVLRDALRRDDDVLVATKVGGEPNPGGAIALRLAQRPEQLRASVEANLTSLRLDRLPLVNLRRAEVGPGLIAEGDQVVDLDDQLAVLTELRDAGKVGAIGLSNVTLSDLRRALPVGIACVQNSYSLVSRGSEDLLDLCTTEDIAWVPYFPLGGAFPGLPKVIDEPAVRAAAQALGVTPAQVGLAWLLAHTATTHLIPGTADLAHLEANLAVGGITLDAATLAALDAVPSRSGDIAAP
ncbi:aldo/keto reductase [Kineococcus sp. NBC_00420]|uniref:aldo/keto reductase n=1 Tax=Kineococcus sp. NBC_00420 TaxID=2903564 RepID=UPI002E1DA5E3